MLINRLKLWYNFMEQQGFKTRQECLSYLDGLGIKYVLHEHEPVFNMEQLSQVKLGNSPHIKNLFYADKKPNSFYMVVAETNTPVNKGTLFSTQDFGKPSEPPTTMSDLPKKSKLNPFSKPRKDQWIYSDSLMMKRKKSRSSSLMRNSTILTNGLSTPWIIRQLFKWKKKMLLNF